MQPPKTEAFVRKLIWWLITHGAAVAVGFALGVYFLPILTAPEGPDPATLERSAADALFQATLTRDLPGSDFLHWGEGAISVTATRVVHTGALAPGPDYKLYLTKSLVTHEDDFDRAEKIQVGDIKTFDGFIVDLPDTVDPAAYTAVLVWCEAFGEFITAAAYQ